MKLRVYGTKYWVGKPTMTHQAGEEGVDLNCKCSLSMPGWALGWQPGLGHILKTDTGGFPGGPGVKNPPANTRDMGLIPGHKRLHVLWDS